MIVRKRNGIWLSLFVLALISCEKKASLESEGQKSSYGIGYQIGNNFKSQNFDLDLAAVAAGIEDGFKGADKRVSEEEIRAALSSQQEKASASQSEAADGNQKKAEEFLEKNKDADGVEVTDSGLQYQVLEEGDGEKPNMDDRVKVHYKGTLLDGTEFDSSYERGEPITFPLSGVIQGWTEGVQLMPVGSKYKFFIKPELGYGPQATGNIPPNSLLVFEVELLEIVEEE